MRAILVRCFAVICIFTLATSCRSSSGQGVAYNFNGLWQTSMLVLSDNVQGCENIVGPIAENFESFQYTIEQVGENITLRDESGELTGFDLGTNFSVLDESENPGMVLDPSTLQPQFNDENIECRVQTSVNYRGESPTSGVITLEFYFECRDITTGELLNNCTIGYTGTATLLTNPEVQAPVSGAE